MNGRFGDRFIVIQNQQHAFTALCQAIDQSGEHRLPCWLRLLIQIGKGQRTESWLARLQRGEDIGPELNWDSVACIERHPGHRPGTWRKRANLGCEQRGLAKACAG